MNILKAETISPRLEEYIQSVRNQTSTGAVYGGTWGKIFGSHSSAVTLQQKLWAAEDILKMYKDYLQEDAPNPAKSAEELVEYITKGYRKEVYASGRLKVIIDDMLKQIQQKDAKKLSPAPSPK